MNQSNRKNAGIGAGVVGLLACGVLLGGCSTDVNSRATIGAERGLPVFEARDAALAMGDGTTGRLDRGDWAAVEFRVPVDGTVHAPLWKSGPSFGDDHRRAHGLYPTKDSALELGNGAGGEAARGFVEPARALVDLVAMPVRMVLEPAWTKTQGPSMYKRWHSGEWLAGPRPEPSAGESDS